MMSNKKLLQKFEKIEKPKSRRFSNEINMEIRLLEAYAKSSKYRSTLKMLAPIIHNQMNFYILLLKIIV